MMPLWGEGRRRRGCHLDWQEAGETLLPLKVAVNGLVM